MKPEELRAIQARLGWSNRVLAKVLGSATRTVEDWRAGKRPIQGPVVLALHLLDALRRADFSAASLILQLGDAEELKRYRVRHKQ